MQGLHRFEDEFHIDFSKSYKNEEECFLPVNTDNFFSIAQISFFAKFSHH